MKRGCSLLVCGVYNVYQLRAYVYVCNTDGNTRQPRLSSADNGRVSVKIELNQVNVLTHCGVVLEMLPVTRQ